MLRNATLKIHVLQLEMSLKFDLTKFFTMQINKLKKLASQIVKIMALAQDQDFFTCTII